MSKTFRRPPTPLNSSADQVADRPAATIARLRDRAIIGVLQYTNASIDTVTALQVKDYYSVSNRRWLCLLQDGHIQREELVNAELEYLLDRYITMSGIAQDLNTPLFRSTLSGTGKISNRRIHRYHVVKLARQVSNLNSLRLTRDTAERLLYKIKPSTTENLRDRAIIGMLLYASATPSEIAGIRTSNYLDNGEWCCIKLARSRIVEVPEALRTLLRDYVRAENPPADGLLFRVDRTRGMTAANVGKMIQRRLNEVEPSQTVG